jgi:HTH-type transcriptional regulator/antitoxin MqsA
MPDEQKGESKSRCPCCGSGRPLEARSIRDEFDYGAENERVRVVAEDVPVLVCPACDEVFYGPEAEQVHHRAICKALGLLTPEEIKSLRERLGKSQVAFAQLTGIEAATLSRWEQGRLMQSRALDNYLRILDALPEAVLALERMSKYPVSLSNPGYHSSEGVGVA